MALIQVALAVEWLPAGWGKFTEPGFIEGLGGTLAGFAAKTPHVWFSQFLTNTVVPNASFFGNLVRFGEVSVGIALLVGALWMLTQKMMPMWVSTTLAVASVGAIIMNGAFYLAAGWASPSTAGINMLMILVHAISAAYFMRERKMLAS